MTLPNILTFFRLLLVPVLLLLWDSKWTWAPLLCAVTFITAAVTDWADGYLARRVGVPGRTIQCSAHAIRTSLHCVLE